jgi:hypothetical protein
MKGLVKIGIVGFIACATALPTRAQGPDPFMYDWLERPWEYRYLLYSDTVRVWQFDRKRDAESRVKTPAKHGEYGEEFAAHFEPTLTLALAGGDAKDYLNVVRLDVRPDGSLVQRNLRADILQPKITDSLRLMLSPAETKPSYLVDFGFFFMGALGASDPRYSPTICSLVHGDGTPIDRNSRYAKGYTAEWGSNGYFGCREWAAQLYDSQRPYIDVTSYEMKPDRDAPVKKGKKPPLIPVTYIKPFVGFSRYDSAPKPVIGNHQGQWFCITDCPAGDAPGPIADMQAWVKRSGWAMPKKPKDVREFRDRPVKAEDLAE